MAGGTGGKIVRVVIKAEDQVSRVLKQMQSQLNRLERSVNSTNSSVTRMTRTTNTQYSQISTNISNATNRQHDFSNAVTRSLSPVKQLTDAVKTLIITYMGLNAAESIIKTSDAITLTTARLDLFNDGLQTTAELTDSIYEAAQRSRGSYLDMADLVAKYTAVAGDNFGSTKDVIAFTEILQKMFTVSGASGQEIYSASLQLKQALGTGRLMGEEFRAVMEAAPLFGKAIAEYMSAMSGEEIRIGDLKELASDSKITADIMVGAMFAAADDINAKFEEMPYTFNQVWTQLKNTVVRGLDDVWKKLTNILNNGQLDQFITAFGNAIIIVVNILVTLFDWVTRIYNFIASNWSWIAPIVWSIVGALTAWFIVTKAFNIVNAIKSAILAVQGFIIMANTARTDMLAGATFRATVAQYGFNAALWACPLTWILLLIIAVIGAIYLLIGAINKLTGSTISATGVITGVISVAVASVINAFINLWNTIIDIFAMIWDAIAMLVNFFGNAFNDPIGAVANLFIDLANLVLSVVQIIAGAIDAVTFGALGLSDTVQNWKNDLNAWGDETFEQKVYMEDSNALKEKFKADYIGIGEAWDYGYNLGKGIDESVGGLFGGLDDLSGTGSETDWSKLASEYGLDSSGADGTLGGIAGDVSNIADGVSVSNEDLKYLRQLAEQRAINRFTTAEIKIDMNNSNTITGTQDIDGIVSKLEEKLYESMSIAAEGVHV